MMRKVQEGDVCFCLTPDGPQGPIYQVHHGIIKMASQSGLPIVPVCIEYESCWRLNKAWDRYADSQAVFQREHSMEKAPVHSSGRNG